MIVLYARVIIKLFPVLQINYYYHCRLFTWTRSVILIQVLISSNLKLQFYIKWFLAICLVLLTCRPPCRTCVSDFAGSNPIEGQHAFFGGEVKPHASESYGMLTLRIINEILRKAKLIISFASLSCFSTRWLLVELPESSGERIRSFPLSISFHLGSQCSLVAAGHRRSLTQSTLLLSSSSFSSSSSSSRKFLCLCFKLLLLMSFSCISLLKRYVWKWWLYWSFEAEARLNSTWEFSPYLKENITLDH
jgi:hypothetical protein